MTTQSTEVENFSKSDPQPPSEFPSLRFPVLVLSAYWLCTLFFRRVDQPYFYDFMLGMAASALATLLVLGWLVRVRGTRRREFRWAAVVLLGGMALAGLVSHRTVNLFFLWSKGFPLVATLGFIWLLIARHQSWSRVRSGFLATCLIGWGSLLLIRTDGVDSKLRNALHWRWTPTAEQMFLASSLRKPAPSSAATLASAAPRDPGILAAELDWPAFRGTNRDGVVYGSRLGTNWIANPPQLVWRHPVGPAWSSVSVVGNRLFTQEQRGDDEVVVCYDAKSGAELWVHADKSRFDEIVSGTGPRATPTFFRGQIFTLGATGILNCLDAETGRAIWRRDAKEPAQAKVPIWAFSSSPWVTEELVVVHVGGEAAKGLLAFRRTSGELAWAAPAGSGSYSSPQLTDVAGVPQFLMLHDAGLSAHDPASGKVLWETGAAMKGAPRCGQPRLVAGNQLLVATLDGTSTTLLEVTHAGATWTTTNRWESRDFKPEFPDFVVHKGFAYGFDTALFACLNLREGKRAWKDGRYGRGQVVLLADRDQLLVSTEFGELVLLAADPTGHRELTRFQAISGKTWNHAVVVGNRVFHRNAEEMACYSFSEK